MPVFCQRLSGKDFERRSLACIRSRREFRRTFGWTVSIFWLGAKLTITETLPVPPPPSSPVLAPPKVRGRSGGLIVCAWITDQRRGDCRLNGWRRRSLWRNGLLRFGRLETAYLR